MKQMLVVVDMQNDFIGGTLGSGQAEAIVPRVAEKIRAAREAGWTSPRRNYWAGEKLRQTC